MNKNEIKRYLQHGGENPEIEAMLDECIAAAQHEILPKSIYKEFDCKVSANKVTIGTSTFVSQQLAKTLTGCNRAIVFAATLGSRADEIIKRESVLNITKAAVYQAVFSQMIEEFCDAEQAKIALSHPGAVLTARFSPGYYDLQLENQKAVFKMLDITKRIGVSLSSSLMMVPSKSVTAVMGVKNEH